MLLIWEPDSDKHCYKGYNLEMILLIVFNLYAFILWLDNLH